MDFEPSLFDDEHHAYVSTLWVWTHGNKGFEPGGFAESLINAFIRADGHNLKRLTAVYPAYGKALARVKQEGV